MRFRCVKKCFWNNTLFEKGVTVDLDEKAKVPEHFVKEENTERGQEGENIKAKVKAKK